jgi:DNA (cytosine-5)-methyltransferase 1
MEYFSMFSGIGGFELGISNVVDWKCIGYSEIDKYAIQIYKKHFREHVNYGDATKINERELPNFDLLVAGFPCQAFSIAGNRKGFDDTRGTLFFDISRIVREKQPQYLLLENVKGLLSHEEGETFAVILTVLDELGYDAEWQVLNSKNFGTPQNRERIFIIGHLRSKSTDQVLPIEGKDGAFIEPYEKTSGSREWVFPTIYTKNHRGDATYVYESDRIRTLTPLECERLQGFPDGWTEGISDTQRYKCIGNAVTVNVVQAVVENMIGKNTSYVFEIKDDTDTWFN